MSKRLCVDPFSLSGRLPIEIVALIAAHSDRETALALASTNHLMRDELLPSVARRIVEWRQPQLPQLIAALYPNRAVDEVCVDLFCHRIPQLHLPLKWGDRFGECLDTKPHLVIRNNVALLFIADGTQPTVGHGNARACLSVDAHGEIKIRGLCWHDASACCHMESHLVYGTNARGALTSGIDWHNVRTPGVPGIGASKDNPDRLLLTLATRSRNRPNFSERWVSHVVLPQASVACTAPVPFSKPLTIPFSVGWFTMPGFETIKHLNADTPTHHDSADLITGEIERSEKSAGELQLHSTVRSTRRTCGLYGGPTARYLIMHTYEHLFRDAPTKLGLLYLVLSSLSNWSKLAMLLLVQSAMRHARIAGVAYDSQLDRAAVVMFDESNHTTVLFLSHVGSNTPTIAGQVQLGARGDKCMGHSCMEMLPSCTLKFALKMAAIPHYLVDLYRARATVMYGPELRRAVFGYDV